MTRKPTEWTIVMEITMKKKEVKKRRKKNVRDCRGFWFAYDDDDVWRMAFCWLFPFCVSPISILCYIIVSLYCWFICFFFFFFFFFFCLPCSCPLAVITYGFHRGLNSVVSTFCWRLCSPSICWLSVDVSLCRCSCWLWRFIASLIL